MNALAFIPASDPGAAHHRTAPYAACLALAQQLGVTLRRHNDGSSTFDDTQLRAGRTPKGDEGTPGDVILVASLTDLGPNIAGLVRAFTGRGLRVYSADQGLVPLGAHLPVLEAVTASFAPLLAENKALRSENAAIEGRWRKLYDETVSNALIHAVRELVPTLVAKMPCLGEVNSQGESTPKHVGEIVRHERERQGLTAVELGQKAGISQASVSNLEAGRITAGEARDRCMAALFGPRSKMVEDRLTVARVVEENGGGSTPAAAIIS